MSEKRLNPGPRIHDILARRWSPRAYAATPVEPDKVRACLEAARWAPSCYNDQPWHFIVATRDQGDVYDRLLACLADMNQAWAKAAPVLMISVARTTFTLDGKPNRHGQHDVGLATMNLMIQAAALGLHAHAMGGFDRDAARRAFGIPAGFEPMAAIALGYLGDPATLPDDRRRMEVAPRERRPMRDWVFGARWGETSTVAIAPV